MLGSSKVHKEIKQVLMVVPCPFGRSKSSSLVFYSHVLNKIQPNFGVVHEIISKKKIKWLLVSCLFTLEMSKNGKLRKLAQNVE